MKSFNLLSVSLSRSISIRFASVLISHLFLSIYTSSSSLISTPKANIKPSHQNIPLTHLQKNMASQQAVVQFIYPKSAASSFNKEYYLTQHGPLIEKLWGSQGLISVTVVEGDKDADYHVQAITVWKSLEAFENLKQVEPVLDDVKNFTDGAAKRLVGTVIGQIGGN